MTKVGFMLLFTAQCDGCIGGPLNNETVPYPLGIYTPKNTLKSAVLPSTTATSVASRSAAADVVSTGTADSRPANAASIINDGNATILDDKSGHSSHNTATVTPLPADHDSSKPGLNIAAIVGIASGGTVLLTFVVVLVAFILRRRKRKQVPTSTPPESREVHTKAELDGNMVAYYDTKCGEGAHIDTSVHAELDGGSLVTELAGYFVSSTKN
jgi:hypothetical protein